MPCDAWLQKTEPPTDRHPPVSSERSLRSHLCGSRHCSHCPHYVLGSGRPSKLPADKLAELKETAAKLCAPGKCFLDADESGGPWLRARHAEAAKIPDVAKNRAEYRSTCFSTPGLSEHIGGVILHWETLFQQDAQGKAIVDIIKDNGMIPAIKVDKGYNKKGIWGTPTGPLRHPEVATVGLDDLQQMMPAGLSAGRPLCQVAQPAAVGSGEANAHRAGDRNYRPHLGSLCLHLRARDWCPLWSLKSFPIAPKWLRRFWLRSSRPWHTTIFTWRVLFWSPTWWRMALVARRPSPPWLCKLCCALCLPPCLESSSCRAIQLGMKTTRKRQPST